MRTHELAERVRRELPSLTEEQAGEVTAALAGLVAAFQPERIYAFGSRARDDADPDSDIDLMIIINHSDEPGCRRGRRAYGAVGQHRHIGMDLLVITRGEFDSRRRANSSLAATVLREGKELYAA
jgi:predicted nucleotidyltransferase